MSAPTGSGAADPHPLGSLDHPFRQSRLHRWVLRAVYAFFRLFYRLRVDGIEHLPRQGPAILVSNHPSYFDPPLLYISAPRCVHFLTWDRLFTIPGIGSFCRSCGAIPVDLERGAPSTYKIARQVVEEGEMLGVFPEGHRTRSSERIDPFKRGAFRLARQTGAPIVPITIVGPRKIWPYGQTIPLLRGRIRIVVHPPIDPRQEDGPAAESNLSQRVRQILDDTLRANRF